MADQQMMPGQGAPEAMPDDAETARRMNGWMNIGQQVRQDPALRQALILFGAHMMQPVQPGDTALGQAGRAMAAGTLGYQAAAGDIADQQARAVKEAAVVEHTRAQTEHARAEAGATTSRTRREEELQPYKIAGEQAGKRKAEAEAGKLEEEYKVLQAKRDAGLLTPVELKRMHELDVRRVEAETGLRSAQAGEAGARAAKEGVEARQKEQELAVFDAFRNYHIDQLDEAGRRDPAKRREAEYKATQDFMEHKRRSSGAGVSPGVQTAMYWRDTLKKLNPGASEQEIAAKELELKNMGVIVRALVEKSSDVLDEAGAAEARTTLQKMLSIKPAMPAMPAMPAARAAIQPAAKEGPVVEQWTSTGQRVGTTPAPAPTPAAAPALGATNLPKGAVVHRNPEYDIKNKALNDTLARLGPHMTPSQAQSLLNTYSDVMSEGQKLSLTVIANQGPQ